MKVDLKSLVLAGVPQTTVKISDGTEVQLRAFLVKELKLLMLAKEGGSEDRTILQVMQQCILTPGIDVELLPAFDVEMMYLHLYMLSKGSSLVEIPFVCQNEVDGKPCGHRINTRVNLKTVKLDKDITKDNMIKVSGEMVLELRYPSVLEQEYFAAVKTAAEGAAKLIDMCLNCVKSINAKGQKLVVGTDISKEEIAELMELVSGDVFAQITKFIEDTPMVHTHIGLKCNKCGYEEAVELRGLSDFFD